MVADTRQDISGEGARVIEKAAKNTARSIYERAV